MRQLEGLQAQARTIFRSRSKLEQLTLSKSGPLYPSKPDQYGGGLLRPTYCLPQGDFRPAETHRNPSGDLRQHELAGVTTIVIGRQVIRKLVALSRGSVDWMSDL